MKNPQLPSELTGQYGFRNFIFLLWKHLGLPDPTPVQYDVCDFLQHGPQRAAIQAYRGMGKSWITSGFVLWTLLLDPQKKILVVSASKDRADAFSTFTRRLLDEVPILMHLVPLKGQRDSRISFDVGPADADHSPSVKSVGITGQMTGSRADLIVADDIEVANNSETELKRIKLAESIKEFDAIIKPALRNAKGEIVKQGGRVVFLGTPQSEQSVYSLLPERGFEVRIWPARLPSKPQEIAYGDKLAPLIQTFLEDPQYRRGDPVDPLRFDDTDLMNREASYGRSGFALQFQLDTSLSDAEKYPLRLRDLIVLSCDHDQAPEKLVWASGPQTRETDLQNVGFNGDGFYRPMAIQGDFIPYTGCVMSVDPSGRGADECAYAVVKMLNGYLYLVASGGFWGTGYSEETLRGLADIAKVHGVNHIVSESNMGNGMFSEILSRALREHDYPVEVEDVHHSTQKEARIIDTLEPVMNQHKLVVDRRVIELDSQANPNIPVERQLSYTLFRQLTRLTRDRGSLAHDDRLDALSMAVAYWVEQIGVSDDDCIDDRKQQLLEEELERLDRMSVGAPIYGLGKAAGGWLRTRARCLKRR